MRRPKINLAIVGATGAVGKTFLTLLEKRNFPVDGLTLFASPKSIGRKLVYCGKEYEVKSIEKDSFKNIDLAFFSAGATISKYYAHKAVNSGAIVIDNSSAFRLDEDVPLIISEVNPEKIFTHTKGIIANPNCTTIIMLVALKPLYDYSRIKRVIVSTYQASSGAGEKGLAELITQTKKYAEGVSFGRKYFQHQLLFNVIPQIDDFKNNGYTKEEMKMFNETRKILGDENITVNATCVRVPVLTAHSESITIETKKKISPKLAREIFKNSPGITLLDDTVKYSEYPTPLFVAGKENCYVGRIRKDLSTKKGLSFWVVGDQLIKGGALNAIQIAEHLIK